MSGANGRPRVLTLARSYPNPVIPLLGLWSQRIVHCAAGVAETKVISPVPWAPPLGDGERVRDFTRFRAVPQRAWDDGVEVLHPRILVGPGHSTFRVESASYTAAAGRAAARLRESFPFDVVHAHFLYPDGVAACLLGRRYGVPTVITEMVPWHRALQRSGVVRRQAAWAARNCRVLLSTSRYIAQTVADLLGVAHAQPVPLSLDAAMMEPPAAVDRDPRQILFVGAVRHVKGLDVLVEALPLVARRLGQVRLVVAGDPFYRAYRREFERVMEQARALGVASSIDVVGAQSPAEVARLMASSAVVAVPSRLESFGSVIIEALACGTPVVATRSGGPEELVDDGVGTLVAREDPVALAEALADVMSDPGRYDASALRRHALERYSPQVVAGRLAHAYETALAA